MTAAHIEQLTRSEFEYHKTCIMLHTMIRHWQVCINLAKDDLKLFEPLDLFNNVRKAKHRITIYQMCIARCEKRLERMKEI